MPIPAYYDAPDHLEGSVPMRGDDPRHDAMFSYITPEACVRADHPLRPIRRLTDASGDSAKRSCTANRNRWRSPIWRSVGGGDMPNKVAGSGRRRMAT